jgi:hypothetical protein
MKRREKGIAGTGIQALASPFYFCHETIAGFDFGQQMSKLDIFGSQTTKTR